MDLENYPIIEPKQIRLAKSPSVEQLTSELLAGWKSMQAQYSHDTTRRKNFDGGATTRQTDSLSLSQIKMCIWFPLDLLGGQRHRRQILTSLWWI